MGTDGRSTRTHFAELAEERRTEAAARFKVLKPHLDDGVPLARVAADAGVPIRTLRRWLSRYRSMGLAGLVRTLRSDAGHQKLAPDVVDLIEGLALIKPRLTIAAIHRCATTALSPRNTPAPSYGSVYAIVRKLDPAMLTLAHEGMSAFRNRFELIYRHRAERPNALWQADHTQLDILVIDADGSIVRPWLTTVIDDHSRVVAGYMVFVGAPSALHTSLALRQAIWRKSTDCWPVCGIPDALYVDHGSDFTSNHLDQVAADLRIQLTYSAVGCPQGRGKVERLFGTLNTELLSELPGNIRGGKPVSPPSLSVSELDAAIGRFITITYNARVHSSIGTTPLKSWLGDGWLPRMPESLEDLDLLLVMVARPRVVHRDGIHFEGSRYLDPTLASYVGESVTVRYDPRDVGEIRVFHRNQFLCRAISPEYAGYTITLKDIQTARTEHRRALRSQITEKVGCVKDFLPDTTRRTSPEKPKPQMVAAKRRLRTYFEDDP
ncbi:Mu transposase C-terminal domain-containing protein [Rhizobium rhizosphaerae]|uniref:Mu transposase C-terminal domain-containing protein n=1 Tax=Xaviernesmea rhizosphaerae TaxID=1672749 RepID=UPI000AAE4429|nr:Mu transposase C-terminal domain-containing protein [Xaviernesmea rhizosphaerae]